MKSIQTKITLLILAVIVVCSSIIGSAGIISSKLVIETDSAEIINLMCSDKAKEINNILGKIEQSVDILAVFSESNLESTKALSDNDYLAQYIDTIDQLSITAVGETEGAASVYLRFDQSVAPADAGFYRVKNSETGRFELVENTDISAYSPGDTEHVGWFYIPVRNKAPTWLPPYRNANININIISYCIPIYKNGALIGVVGMDIDFNYISNLVDSIKVYDTGYAFLVDSDMRIAYHKKILKGQSVSELNSIFLNKSPEDFTKADTIHSYIFNDTEKKIVFRLLENNMYLAVTAPVSEIDKTERQLVDRIIKFTILIALVSILLSSFIAKSLIKPLKELNNAAKDIAKGNLDITLVPKTKDEIGALTGSLRDTARELKKRIEYINELAFTDTLTGIGSNAAYLRDVMAVKETIAKGTADFSLAIIDVNNLKHINDNYGHDSGNILIIQAAETAVSAFGKDRVYRIGGDEFAVIMNNVDEATAKLLAERFVLMLKEAGGRIVAAAAIGTATYSELYGDSYDTVFKRADEEMYRRKAEMKEKGECSRVIM